MRGIRSERMRALNDKYSPWTAQTIWDRFNNAVEIFPDNDLLVMDDGVRLTYSQAKQEALNLAAALQKKGVRSGDFVALKLSNCPEAVLFIFALSYCGAIDVSVNAASGPYELAYVLNKTHTRYLISDKKVSFPVESVPESLETIIYLSSVETDMSKDSIGDTKIQILFWDEFCDAACAENAKKSLQDPYSVAKIMFTSGSMGNPKGVVLTHDQLMRSSFANALNRGFEEGRRILVLVPLFHCFAYIEGLLAGLFVGATQVYLTEKFDESRVIALMEYEQINDVLIVPYMAERLVGFLEKHSHTLPAYHAMYCGGERASGSLWQRIMAAFNISDIVNGYGMTETCGAVMQIVPGDSKDILSTKVGRIMPAGCAGMLEYEGQLIKYRVMDSETGKELPIGECGELQCRGYVVMQRYFDDEKATEDSFTSDGWFKTGDLGWFDTDGYLQLKGRSKNSYRINGENVSPEFVERIIERCSLVKQAIVVGIPNKHLGAVGALFVQICGDEEAKQKMLSHEEKTSNQNVLTSEGKDSKEATSVWSDEDGIQDTLASIEQFCKANLARFQVPLYYRVMDEEQWPRTLSGKIQRFRLREMLIEELQQSHS